MDQGRHRSRGHLAHTPALLLALAALLAVPMLGVGGIAHAQTQVPLGWSLIPSGLGPGDQFRLIFVNSTTRNAESSDIAVYNTHVQNAAAGGHADIQAYSSQFRAVASTPTVHAFNNTETTHTTASPGVPIYWLNGASVADDYNDFYDGSRGWNSTTPTNELGTSNPATAVWTGSLASGAGDTYQVRQTAGLRQRNFTDRRPFADGVAFVPAVSPAGRAAAPLLVFFLTVDKDHRPAQSRAEFRPSHHELWARAGRCAAR